MSVYISSVYTYMRVTVVGGYGGASVFKQQSQGRLMFL